MAIDNYRNGDGFTGFTGGEVNCNWGVVVVTPRDRRAVTEVEGDSNRLGDDAATLDRHWCDRRTVFIDSERSRTEGENRRSINANRYSTDIICVIDLTLSI